LVSLPDHVGQSPAGLLPLVGPVVGAELGFVSSKRKRLCRPLPAFGNLLVRQRIGFHGQPLDTSGAQSTPDSDIVEARFIELVPSQRVVYAVDFVSDDPAYAGTMTMTWEVTALHEGTRVDITADNVPDGVTQQDHVAGMTSSLDKLAQHLEQ
jgi:hypothetical protein